MMSSSSPSADERPALAESRPGTRTRRRRRVPSSALVLLQLCLQGASGLDRRLESTGGPARPRRPTTVGGHNTGHAGHDPPRPPGGRGRRRAKATGKKNGAFNPHLTSHDPNHSDYQHGSPSGGASVSKVEAAPASWSPCPDDPSFAGNRASRDCMHYVYCANGKPRGEYQSCHGLLFDNSRGTCDWAETVDCGGSGGGIGGSAKGHAAASTGGSHPNVPGVTEEMAQQLGWSGGEDWGGSWINGKWVPTGESAKSPASAPSEFAWVEQEWKSQVGPYPPHEVLPVHEIQRGDDVDPATLPREYVSREGWSSATRTRSVVGYYSVHNWYDNGERSKPANLQLSKVDRVNFAFFQLDESGSIWGTDSYADQITLFGPADWSVTDPQRYGYAPQFNDDNGFDDGGGGEWNYVGRHHVGLPEKVYCHRTNPVGKRDCRGHRGREGIIERAHRQGALVYPSIGGWSLSGPYPALAANAKARRNFAKNCVGLIREYNFDGIDIDWEFPGYAPHGGTPDDTKNYVLLLRDVRAALDAYAAHAYPDGERVFGLTAAMPCTPSVIERQDIESISSILDEVNLMTYDFHGTWNDRVGVNSPLYDQPPDLFESEGFSVHSCVEAWASGGADRSAINIGVPFYGRSYADGTELYGEFGAGADGAHWHADQGVPQYYSIEEKLPEMITLRDEATRTQYAFFLEERIVSFDDRESVCDKVEYARAEGLSGMIIWDLSGDLNEDLMTPLLDVINFKLQLGDDFACDHLRLETRDENGDVFKLEKRDNPWYAVYATGGECINDGKQSVWESEENLFRHKEECCMVKFEYRFDDCLGPPTYPPTAKPTRQPTKSPVISDEPTLDPTAMWAGAQVMDSSLAAGDGPPAPVTWCLGGCGGRGKCVGNQNHPQNIADSDCKPCDGGQTYWPCDVDGLCFCWDESKPRIPPAPSSGKAQLSDERPCEYFTKAMFDSLAPEARHPYTYEGLCDAIDNYNEGHAEKIFMMGTEFEKKSELAAFLGHTLHESDEWKAAREYLICADHVVQGGETFCKPCDSGSFNWETFKCDGVGLAGGGLSYNGYCDQVLQPPQACECDPTLVGGMDGGPEGYIPASKVFFGRGAIQLSWNYNFRAASEALSGDPTTFCENPDLVATEPAYAWGAGVFFWMESLKEETTCHKEALAGDFGGTLNTINGGLECPAYHGGWHGEAIKLRLNRYCKATTTLGLESILIMEGCKGLNNSFAECLHDGSCPSCDQFSDTVGTWVPHTDLPGANEALPETTPAVTTKLPDKTTTTTTTATSLPGVPEFSVPKGCEDGYKAVNGLPGCCVPEPAYHGDGACDADAPYNTPLCNFDGGDCCRETCDLKNSIYKCRSVEYGPFGFFCLNPDVKEYIDSSACIVPDKSKIGDGECNGLEYNNAACGYDGGDCCEETCDATYAHYECGAVPYNCVDPELRKTPKPTEMPTTDRPTSEPTSRAPTNQPTKKPTSPPTAADVEPLPNSEQVVTSLVSIVTSADSSLLKGSPDQNFGTDAKLSVRGNSNNPGAHESIIKFDIPASDFPTSTPVSAVLRVFSLVDSDSGGIFHVVGNNQWSEDSVNWDSAPMWDAQGRIDSIGQIRVNVWYTIDVSDAVARLNGEAGHISIRIRSRTSDVVEYSSKEGPSPPELMIAYGRQTIPDPPQAKTDEVAQPPTILHTSKPSNPPSSPPTAPLVQVQKTFNIEASQDSTLIKKHPDLNYGNQPILVVQGMSSGPNAHDAIMRFKIPGRPADIPASTQMYATFNIYSMADAIDGGIFHLAPEAGPWDEKEITWNNSPDWVDRLGKLGAVRKGEVYTIDVTEAIASLGGAAGIVNVRARSRSPSVAEYSSREGRQPPTIFVSYGDMEQNLAPSFGDAFGSKPTHSTADSPARTSEPTRMPTARPTSPSFVATEPGEYVFGPSDDSVIVEMHPTDNYGGQDEIMVDRDSGTLDSLLRFALSGIDTNLISRATLRLYCTDGSDFGGEFRRTISSKWDETTVVWENAPRGYGSPLHTLGAVQANKWYEIDLTAMVVGMQDDLSIRIHSTASDNRAAFSSKEGAHPPQLVLTIGEIEEEITTTVAPSDSTSPDTMEPVSTNSFCCRDSSSKYYPLWSHGHENDGCSTDRPTWAVGVYLKETRSDCCRTFFKLQEDQCIETSNDRLL